MFTKQEHPVLVDMGYSGKQSASRTAVRMSLAEVRAAKKIYDTLYPNTPLPSNQSESTLILAHLSNTYGYPTKQENVMG